MYNGNVRVQADDLNLSRPVLVERLVAIAVLAVQVLSDGSGSQLDSSAKFDELLSLDAGVHDPRVVQYNIGLLRVQELLLLGQPLVVGHSVGAVSQSSRAPPVQRLVVHSLGRLD